MSVSLSTCILAKGHTIIELLCVALYMRPVYKCIEGNTMYNITVIVGTIGNDGGRAAYKQPNENESNLMRTCLCVRVSACICESWLAHWSNNGCLKTIKNR